MGQFEVVSDCRRGMDSVGFLLALDIRTVLVSPEFREWAGVVLGAVDRRGSDTVLRHLMIRIKISCCLQSLQFEGLRVSSGTRQPYDSKVKVHPP